MPNPTTPERFRDAFSAIRNSVSEFQQKLGRLSGKKMERVAIDSNQKGKINPIWDNADTIELNPRNIHDERIQKLLKIIFEVSFKKNYPLGVEQENFEDWIQSIKNRGKTGVDQYINISFEKGTLDKALEYANKIENPKYQNEKKENVDNFLKIFIGGSIAEIYKGDEGIDAASINYIFNGSKEHNHLDFPAKAMFDYWKDRSQEISASRGNKIGFCSWELRKESFIKNGVPDFTEDSMDALRRLEIAKGWGCGEALVPWVQMQLDARDAELQKGLLMGSCPVKEEVTNAEILKGMRVFINGFYKRFPENGKFSSPEHAAEFFNNQSKALTNLIAPENNLQPSANDIAKINEQTFNEKTGDLNNSILTKARLLVFDKKIDQIEIEGLIKSNFPNADPKILNYIYKTLSTEYGNKSEAIQTLIEPLVKLEEESRKAEEELRKYNQKPTKEQLKNCTPSPIKEIEINQNELEGNKRIMSVYYKLQDVISNVVSNVLVGYDVRNPSGIGLATKELGSSRGGD